MKAPPKGGSLFFTMKPLLYITLTVLLVGCSSGESEPESSAENPSESSRETAQAEMQLVELDPNKTGVTFSNIIAETEDLNYFTFEYMYNGGGVAIGDLNNDGLPDLYFTGNQSPDKLYLNTGNLTFQDVTESAIGAPDNGWHNGVVMADVNADGWLDIYVCRGGNADFKGNRSNLLYLNNGDMTFSESAAQLGLDDTLSSTQASFFDADGDGDLDAYVMNVPTDFNQQEVRISEVKALFAAGKNESDRFYRNKGGHFEEASQEVGINNHAFGLGLATGDLNADGRTDLYVTNDYYVRDYTFYNTGSAFVELSTQVTKHLSNFGMGVDIADFNNDGFEDIMVLDMAYSDHVRSKRNMASMSPEKFVQMQQIGEHKQYMTNTLQMNVGNGTFSEIAQYAGVAKSDWSWSPIFADLDNDGWKDLIITNGFRRDAGDRDFQIAAHESQQQDASYLDLVKLMPTSKVANMIFRNQGATSKFEDATSEWGFERAVNSNGMAIGDLDRDGDLDLVINNMDEVASIYENKTEQGHIQATLVGPKLNPFAVGAKVELLYGDGTNQHSSIKAARGYLSSSEPLIHFGIGGNPEKLPNEIKVTWPDGKVSRVKAVPNERLTINYAEAKSAPVSDRPAPWFASLNITETPFRHTEDPYPDYEREVLLPHSQSRFGPCLATADINGDGTEDLFVGGAYGQTGMLYVQRDDKLLPHRLENQERSNEQQGAYFFDCDGDGDQDLYVALGSPQGAQQDRLYLNDGTGILTWAPRHLPAMPTSTKCVVSADYDGDGDLDLFVGGRTVHGRYPEAPESYLLRNEGGHFMIDERTVGDGFRPGMVTGAVFSDYDKDGDPDLILVGELMPITVFDNLDGAFTTASHPELSQTGGFWQTISVLDLDNDGDDDLVVGNLGENNKFHPSADHPLTIYTNDFDDNGTLDIVLSKYQGNKHYPVRGRECSSQQMPFIQEKFPSYQSFAEAEMTEIYSAEKLNAASRHDIHTMSSYVLWNEDGAFNKMRLPWLAQLGPITSVLPMDVNNDGLQDLLLAGNWFDTEPETVAYDGSHGCCLINRNGSFEAIDQATSGWFAPWNIRSMVALRRSMGLPFIILGVNDGPMRAYQINQLPSI